MEKPRRESGSATSRRIVTSPLPCCFTYCSTLRCHAETLTCLAPLPHPAASAARVSRRRGRDLCMGSVSERDSESIVDSEIVDSRGGDNSRSTAIHYRLSAIYFRSLPVRRRARAGLVVLEQGDQRRIAGAQGLVDRGAAGAGADV